jgi:hypothetical protein
MIAAAYRYSADTQMYRYVMVMDGFLGRKGLTGSLEIGRWIFDEPFDFVQRLLSVCILFPGISPFLYASPIPESTAYVDKYWRR